MTVEAQAVVEKTLIDAVAQTAGVTTDGFIDCLDADYAVLRVNVTKGNTATIASADGATVSVVHSTDSNYSNGVTVAANKTALKLTQTARYAVDMRGKRRFLVARVISGTAGATNDNEVICAVGTLSRLAQSPSSTSGMQTGNTNDTFTIC